MASLDSTRSKLAWANHHFETLEREVATHFGRGNHTVVHEVEPATAHHRFKLTLPDALPADWPLIIADCAHNAHAALDQLAWQFAGADPTDTATQFPIFRDPSKFNPRHIARIKDKRAVAFMKWLQPHRRADPGNDRLWTLYILDNEDKHKTISIALFALGGFQLAQGLPPYTRLQHELEITVGPFVPPITDAVIAEGPAAYFPLDGSPPNPNVEMNFNPTFDIAICAETAGATFLPGLAVLREMLDCVEGVVGLFERL